LGHDGGGVTFGSPEQRLGEFNMKTPWETCAVVEGTTWIWGGGKNIKSPNTCLQYLVACACGDGNLLLNFGPTPEGEIVPAFRAVYRHIGDYLKKYGESIYETRGGPYKPGYWGGSTRRGKNVYLHITEKWPKGRLVLPPLPCKVVSAEAMTGGKVKCVNTPKGLVVEMDPADHADPDTIVKLTLDQDSMTIKPINTMSKEESLTTDANASASSQDKARGNPATVLHYSFETGKIKRHFGEENDGAKEHINRSTGKKWTKEEIAKIRKKIGNNHRGHFWRFWKPKASDPQPWIEIDMGKPVTFGKVAIQELFGQVRSFELQAFQNGKWKTFYKGKELRNFFVDLKKPVTASKVRLVILKNNGEVPSFVKFDLFK